MIRRTGLKWKGFSLLRLAESCFARCVKDGCAAIHKADLHDHAIENAQQTYAKGFLFDEEFMRNILQGCIAHKNVAAGQFVHSLTISHGMLLSSAALDDQIIRFFASFGSLLEAIIIFCNIASPGVYSWHAIILAHVIHGENGRALELYYMMLQEDVQPNAYIFSTILKACGILGALGQGVSIHSLITQCGLDRNVVVGSALVDMYVRCQHLDAAHKVFHRLPNPNPVSWAALISGYVQYGYGHFALELFVKMQQVGAKPDRVTFLCVLRACAIVEDAGQGELVHMQIVSDCLETDVVLGNALVDMYAKCKNIDAARKLFDTLPNRDVVSWGAMITGYAQSGLGHHAVDLYEQMQVEHVKPNKIIFPCVLKSCSDMGALEPGKLIHDQIVKGESDSDIVIGSTLVDMYAKCGSLEEANCVFKRLSARNVVAWGALIGGYVQHGQNFNALQSFNNMYEEGIMPDEMVYMNILKLCATIGGLGQGQLVHGLIVKNGLETDLVIASALINMYAKCGSMKDAWETCKRSPSKNVVLWGSMVAGCAQRGNWVLAQEYIEDMQSHGIQPNATIHKIVLSACCHAGQIQEGCVYYENMAKDTSIQNTEHVLGLIDILCGAGCLKEAENMLQLMHIPPDRTSWTSLLTACDMYGDECLGKHCFDEVIRLNPNAVGFALMSSIYAHAHKGENASKMRDGQVYSGAWKKPGLAWIEANDTIEVFIVGDTSHSESVRLYANLRRLTSSLKSGEHIPALDVTLEHAISSL